MKLGFIGWGTAARNHARIAQQRGHEIVGIYAENVEQVPEWLRRDLEQLTDVDAYVIAIPVGARGDVYEFLREQGKPVFAEKPISPPHTSCADWELLFAAENWLYANGPRSAANLARTWIMMFKGDPRHVQPWLSTIEIGGGAFMEGGAHIATWYLRDVLRYGEVDVEFPAIQFTGTPMCGVATFCAVSDGKPATLTLAIDWTGKNGYDSCAVGFSEDRIVRFSFAEIDGVSFQREWEAFEHFVAGDKQTIETATLNRICADKACELIWKHICGL